MSTNEICPGEARISGRDVEKRIADLESDIAFDKDNGEEPEEDAIEELKLLKELQDDITSDAYLIHKDAFEDYAEELAKNIYSIHEGWPFDHIDWKAAADALLTDYTVIKFGDETYYTRNV